MREGGAIVRVQIHQQKRQIVDHVDPAQRVVEIDAVEHQRVAAALHDVVQVQIAVACADVAVGSPGVQVRGELVAAPHAPRAQRRRQRRAERALERREHVVELPAQLARAAVRAPRDVARRVQMVGGEARRGGIDVRRVERTAREQPGEQHPLVEAAHPDDVVDGRARAEQAQAARAAHERAGGEIDRRGERAVQRELRFARAAARGEFAEIREAEIERLQALVREAPDEINDGEMRFDAHDRAGRMRVGRRAAQRRVDVARQAAGRAFAHGAPLRTVAANGVRARRAVRAAPDGGGLRGLRRARTAHLVTSVDRERARRGAPAARRAAARKPPRRDGARRHSTRLRRAPA